MEMGQEAERRPSWGSQATALSAPTSRGQRGTFRKLTTPTVHRARPRAWPPEWRASADAWERRPQRGNAPSGHTEAGRPGKPRKQLPQKALKVRTG